MMQNLNSMVFFISEKEFLKYNINKIWLKIKRPERFFLDFKRIFLSKSSKF